MGKMIRTITAPLTTVSTKLVTLPELSVFWLIMTDPKWLLQFGLQFPTRTPMALWLVWFVYPGCGIIPLYPLYPWRKNTQPWNSEASRRPGLQINWLTSSQHPLQAWFPICRNQAWSTKMRFTEPTITNIYEQGLLWLLTWQYQPLSSGICPNRNH